MSTVKISQLPDIPGGLNANTSNSLFLGVDIPTGITGKFTATQLAQRLYANNILVVGQNPVVLPNAIGQFSGYSDSYIQINFQNFSPNGTLDFVGTADDGTDTNHYIDFGITGSNYSLDTYGILKQRDGYFLAQGNLDDPTIPGGNLIIFTTTENRDIIFAQGKELTAYANSEVARFVYNTGFKMYQNPIIFADGTSQNTAAAPFAYSNAAFAKANTSLQNTANIIVPGNFTVSGTVLLDSSGVFQYSTSNNSTVTQSTSKSTGVICNGKTGQITTSNASLAGGRSVTFTVTNNQIVSNKDVVILSIASGATTNTYQVTPTAITAGSFDINISNVSSFSQSDALVINFAVLRVN